MWRTRESLSAAPRLRHRSNQLIRLEGKPLQQGKIMHRCYQVTLAFSTSARRELERHSLRELMSPRAKSLAEMGERAGERS